MEEKKLVEKLEAKARASQEAAQRRHDTEIQQTAFHRKAEDVFEKMVEPAMQWAAKLLAKGSRHSDVKHQDYPSPSQTLYVAQVAAPFDWKGADFIRFRTGAEIGKIYVDQKIDGAPGTPTKCFSLVDLTSDKVQELLADFVEHLAETQAGVVDWGSAPSDLLQRLAGHGIVVPNARDVAAYLAAHPQLAQLLPNIGAEVRQTFGPQVELSLELYQDPEIDDRYLTLYLRKDKYEPDILDRLQLVSGRFNPKLEEVSGYFLLATDFSRPRGSHAV